MGWPTKTVVRLPLRTKRYFFSPKCPHRLWGPTRFLVNEYRGGGGRLPERSKPAKAWSWPLHPPHALMACTRTTFTYRHASKGFILCNVRLQMHVTRVAWRQNGYASPPTHSALWALHSYFYLHFILSQFLFLFICPLFIPFFLDSFYISW